MIRTGEGLAERLTADAIDGMVVDHADGLHERVADDGADEGEPPFFKVFAHGVGFRRPAGHVFLCFPMIHHRVPSDESPNVLIERTEFLLNGEKRVGVPDGRLYFEPVPNNSGIVQQCLHLSFVVSGDGHRVEMIEGFSERVTFAQNRIPTQSGLSAFQNEEFKQLHVIVQRHAPFSVMVADEVVIGGPRASDDGGVGHGGVNPGPGCRWS